jgi:hypothetical protein
LHVRFFIVLEEEIMGGIVVNFFAVSVVSGSLSSLFLLALRKRLWDLEGTTMDIRRYQQGPLLEPTKSRLPVMGPYGVL